MIIWDGMDIVCLVIFVICLAILGLAWLWLTIQGKIDEHFERRNKR